MYSCITVISESGQSVVVVVTKDLYIRFASTLRGTSPLSQFFSPLKRYYDPSKHKTNNGRAPIDNASAFMFTLPTCFIAAMVVYIITNDETRFGPTDNLPRPWRSRSDSLRNRVHDFVLRSLPPLPLHLPPRRSSSISSSGTKNRRPCAGTC